MSFRMIRSVVAALAIATMAFVGTTKAQTQVGDAYILFNISTGEFRMNPGNAVGTGGSYTNPSQSPLSFGVNSFGVEMDPAIGTLSTNVNDYYFPSGTWPLFFPQTGANPGNAFGSAFQTWSLPNVNGGAGPSNDSLNANNLVIGSPWTVQTGGSTGSTGAAIPGTTAVYASAIPGYVGTPEFSFGTFGPTNLTSAQALAALGATTEGGFATGNRVYSMQNVVGTQFFKIYTTTAVPEPSTLGLAAAGIATLGASAWRKRKLAKKA
jgi:hypothetical protein